MVKSVKALFIEIRKDVKEKDVFITKESYASWKWFDFFFFSGIPKHKEKKI